VIATGRIMATVIPGSIQSNRDRAELVALRRLGTVEECANVVEVPRDSENERAAQYFIASRSKGFVAFLVLAVTEAERQATGK